MGERRLVEPISLLDYVPGDTGNAHRFLARHRYDARFCHAFKAWYFWNGWCWSRNTQGLAIQLAKTTAIEFLKQACAANNRDSEKLAKAALDAPRINAMLSLAQDEVAIKPEEFDRHPDVLVFKNGVLDLRTGELGPFERQLFITKMVACNYCPEAACPRFISVLRKWMGAEQDSARADRLVAALQVYFGYTLTGHTSSKAVFMVIGPKDTGKTTLLEVFSMLLPEYATLIRIETLMEGPAQRNLGFRSDLADLHGARLARTSETEEGKRLSESLVKYLSQGMGEIRAERKFENPFDFPATHKHPMSHKAFSNRMGNRKGVRVEHGLRGNRFGGVGLRTENTRIEGDDEGS